MFSLYVLLNAFESTCSHVNEQTYQNANIRMLFNMRDYSTLQLDKFK
jgi:hypothetical protein